ncbi:hypothetical protein L1887_16773 [Cichorium endivia]|nr:hypothetical protein L1887_16773 [Cichorium endivia]
MTDALERYLTLRICECSYEEKYFHDICKELGHFVTVDAFVRLPQNVKYKLFEDFNVVLENLPRMKNKKSIAAMMRRMVSRIVSIMYTFRYCNSESRCRWHVVVH